MSSPAPVMENIAVPIDLSAYVLTPSCASKDSRSRIAPVTQPNYVGLRLDEALMQHDLVDHIDFHLTTPAEFNPRMTDIGANPPKLRKNRMGVYLHWSLPRCYRRGKATTQNVNQDRPDGEVPDSSVPAFPVVPNRYFIIRRLKSQTSEDGTKLPEYQSWVVESNRVWKVQDVPESMDLEVDLSPFMADNNNPDKSKILERQAENFIGGRNEYSGWNKNPNDLWKEKQTQTQAAVAGNPQFIDLTVLGSSNPLFPDYTVHNGGVFSTVDCFQYKSNKGETKYLTTATADYYLIGWHSLSKDDILVRGNTDKLNAMLNDLKLSLDVSTLNTTQSEKDNVSSILDLKKDSRVVLHGGLYSVAFDINSKPTSLAEAAASRFPLDFPFKMEPLSVGASAIDAVVTFLRAHRNEDVETVFGPGSAGVANIILSLADLLYAADDSYNQRAKAQDINLYEGHFAKSTIAGFSWNYAAKTEAGKPPKTPSDSEWETLVQLNETQPLLDSLERNLQQTRWELFAVWWKYVTDKSNINDSTKLDGGDTIQESYRKQVKKIAASILELEKRTKAARDLLVDTTTGKALTDPNSSSSDTKDPVSQTFKKVTQSPFYTRKEPTLCIAGIESGWPKDFMDALPVRLERQIPPNKIDPITTILGITPNPIPTELQTTAKRILEEYLSRTVTKNVDDYGKGFQLWGNGKNENPFLPLFVEWEAVYYHIERSKWTVNVRSSPVGLPNSQVRMGIDELLAANADNQRDFRYISGRTLILPQPVFSLESAVRNVLDVNNIDISKQVTKASQGTGGQTSATGPKTNDDLIAQIRKLPFISCPLSGIQEHLLTRVMGTHVKPTINRPGKSNIPLPPAITAAVDIGFSEEILKLIDSSSDVTPYGNLLNFPDNTYPNAPFKSVTHGQMRFTKLNIIDKFGQAIALPPPKPRLRDRSIPTGSIYPCISDFLSPDIVNNHINTIIPESSEPKEGEWPLCKFMQLPPAINQNARINASFLNRSSEPGFPFWKETENDKPESPIFGWIVINYQDSGLQFFRPDGRFYREVRVGGPTGTNAGSKWLPFDPPGAADKVQTGDEQLNELIAKLTDPKKGAAFLSSFFHMINGAIKTMPYPPSDYAGYANALVGKPLALVNVGWSLELALPPLTHQNTLGKAPASEATDLTSYEFPFKIGDADRPFDGVVGYFVTDNITNGNTAWEKLYTYFPDDTNKEFIGIEPSNFPDLSPHYIDPVSRSDGYHVMSSNPKISGRTFNTYREARAAEYLVTTMIVDPYTPIHAYSPILPIKSLSLPPWTIQAAFTRMTAFFRLGPSLISIDVPATYDNGKHLDPDTWAQKADDETVSPDAAPLPAIRLPIAGKKGLWKWLQPYDVRPADAKEGDPNITRYNEMDVNQEDTRIRKDAPPYTFVEGYLQLARPLLAEDLRNTGNF